MTQLRIDTLENLRKSVGQEVAVTNYRTISQEQVDLFAEVTGDRQWIHVDVERAGRESPYKGTIAHGFLTLSLISDFMSEAISFVRPLRLAVNYGLDRVRFPAPLPVGSRVRARVVLDSVDDVTDGVQVKWRVAIECEGAGKPSCVAEYLVRFYP
jgi:acyl dehydratase